MEILFEFIFEVLLEGSFELVKSKKIPLWLRVLVAIPLAVIYGGLFFLFLSLMVDSYRSQDYLFTILFFGIEIGYIALIVHLIKKGDHDETER